VPAAIRIFFRKVKHFANSRHITCMRYFFFIASLCMAALARPAHVSAQDGFPTAPLFSWNLLWAGSWEESRTLHNRGDFRLDFEGLSFRGQVLDRRPLNFETDHPWADFSESTAGGASLGLYHGATGSRLLYGILHETGLPSRIRSPWSRSVPYAENRRPTLADLRTTSSTTRVPEAYLRLSTPHLTLFGGGALPEMSLRGFASAQIASEGNPWPAFSGGLETLVGAGSVSLEGFYTGTVLPARESSTWFSASPSLPDRDFRLAAASLAIDTPYFLFASDLALSQVFAYGNGLYGNAAIRIMPPLSGSARPGPWSLSLAAEGMGERYVGRDGASHGGGLRVAGRIERRGPRSGLFRADTGFRAPSLDDPFDRSSFGVSYRFPTPSARAVTEGDFPLRVSRVSFNANRDASNPANVQDGIDGTFGLSLNLPPMLLPSVLLPPQPRRSGIYPLGINLSAALQGRDSMEFDSLRIGCELLWSPGILQLRTRWSYTTYSDKDEHLEGSISVAVRFRRGRFSARVAWPEFPEKRNYTLSWRLDM